MKYSARFGKYETFEVAMSMAKAQCEVQESRDSLLAVLMQTQSLALRPGVSGKLEKVSESSLGSK